MGDDHGTRSNAKWMVLILVLTILSFVVLHGVHERIWRTLPPEEAAEASNVLLARLSWIVVAVVIASFLWASRSQRRPETGRAILLLILAQQLPQAVQYTWAPDGTPLALRLNLIMSLIGLGVLLVALAGPTATRVVWAGTYVVVAVSVLSCISLFLQ